MSSVPKRTQPNPRHARKEVVARLMEAMGKAADDAAVECDAKLPDYHVAAFEFMRSIARHVIAQSPTPEGREFNRRAVVGRLTDIANEMAGVVGMTIH